jgi:predicted transcriptional regulator
MALIIQACEARVRTTNLISRQEPKMEIADQQALLEHTSSIVAAYVGNNTIPKDHLSALITDIFSSLAGVSRAEPEPEKLTPAVPVKRSVQPDSIICLEDGKKFKSLKRHLMSHYNMTPEDYRQKWGLPADYPMVAPNYALARSTLAKQMGLGRRATAEVVATTPRAAPKSVKKASKKPAGRKSVAAS